SGRTALMSTIASRLSPVHQLLEVRGAQWGRIGSTPTALRFGPDADERAALAILGLCDVSGLRKLGVKGPGAEGWLRERGLELPPAVYDVLPLAGGGLIVRLGASDFFLEDGVGGEMIDSLSGPLAASPPSPFPSPPSSGGEGRVRGVIRVQREDATFLL